ncbi:MAG: hypothetical protein ACRYGR_06035, partial [Janthinobacterium lividum]
MTSTETTLDVSAEADDKTILTNDLQARQIEFANEASSTDLSALGKSVQEINDSIKELVKHLKDGDKATEVGASQAEAGFLDDAIPQARRCNVEQFKNRFNHQEATYTLEYLFCGSDAKRELESEKGRRQSVGKKKGPAKKSVAHMSHTTSSLSENGAWIQCVRINSKAVIEALATVSGAEKLSQGAPVIFHRPFRLFIHFHDKVKGELEKLAQQHKDGIDPTTETKDDTIGVSDSLPTKDATTQLRCYVKFIEEFILPEHQKLRNSDASTTCKVRYDDLWSLFKTGDLIYKPVAPQGQKIQTSTSTQTVHAQGQKTQKFTTTQTLSRIHQVKVPVLGFSPRYCCPDRDCDTCTLISKFRCYAYYIDYDGEEYRAIDQTHTINHFVGEKEVTQLPFYPARFLRDEGSIISQARSDGQSFVKHIEKRQGFYNGWSIINTPNGESLTTANGGEIT